MTEDKKQLEHLRDRQMLQIMAAIVHKYGVDLGDGKREVRLTPGDFDARPRGGIKRHACTETGDIVYVFTESKT